MLLPNCSRNTSVRLGGPKLESLPLNTFQISKGQPEERVSKILMIQKSGNDFYVGKCSKSGQQRKSKEPAVLRMAHSVCLGGPWKLCFALNDLNLEQEICSVFAEENHHLLLCLLWFWCQLRWFHVVPNLEWMFGRKYLAILFTLKLWVSQKSALCWHAFK